MRRLHTRHVLEIYVAPSCAGCSIARQRAMEMRELALPDVEVKVIDLSDRAVVRPWEVFAVPIYLLDGKVLSLGNPDLAWLVQQLDDRAPGP